jgi:uncharacterized protein (DUF697 family)/GTP-binding protein EngB required for normal cell division
MGSDDQRKRVERAVEGTREWAERAGGDVVDRLGRAWDNVRRSSPADTPDGEEPEPVDDETLFSRGRQREFEQLGHANILIIGQTGVGKSTLINAIFRKPLAAAGTGRPVTKVIEKFEDPDVPVTLYDTKGVELGDSKNRVIREFKKEISRRRKGPPEEHIHLLWYCMDAGQARVQDYDVDIIKALSEEVPVILVMTQVIDDERADELERTILDPEFELELEGGKAVRTLAQARRIGRQTLPVRGLEELVRLTDQVLPEAVRRAFVNAQGVVLDLKVDRARAVVVATSAAAAGAAAAPVPTSMSDAMLLRPLQLGMLAGITNIFGVELSNDQVLGLLKGAVGQGGMEKAGKKLVKELAKHLPGGNVVNATVAAALTGALGEAYVRLCAEMLRREAAGEPMPNAEMAAVFLDMYNNLLRKSSSEPQASAETI